MLRTSKYITARWHCNKEYLQYGILWKADTDITTKHKKYEIMIEMLKVNITTRKIT